MLPWVTAHMSFGEIPSGIAISSSVGNGDLEPRTSFMSMPFLDVARNHCLQNLQPHRGILTSVQICLESSYCSKRGRIALGEFLVRGRICDRA